MIDTLRSITHEHTIKESVTQKLLKPIEINQAHEQQYQRFESSLIDQKDLSTWFCEHINEYFSNKPNFKAITPEDIGSLELYSQYASLDKFREIYNYDFHRPVFFLLKEDFKKINYKLFNHLSSNGTIISGGSLDKDPLTKGLNIIITSNEYGTSTLKHELKHSLDSQLINGKRQGKDKILSEFAAFWGNVIIPREVFETVQYGRNTIFEREEIKIKKIKWTTDNIRTRLTKGADVYMNQFKNIFNDKKDYIDTISEIAGYITKLQTKFDEFQIDRILMNATKISELKQCVKEQGL